MIAPNRHGVVERRTLAAPHFEPRFMDLGRIKDLLVGGTGLIRRKIGRIGEHFG